MLSGTQMLDEHPHPDIDGVVGYWYGNWWGPRLFNREDSLLFKRKYLVQAHEFYERNGGKAASSFSVISSLV